MFFRIKVHRPLSLERSILGLRRSNAACLIVKSSGGVRFSIDMLQWVAALWHHLWHDVDCLEENPSNIISSRQIKSSNIIWQPFSAAGKNVVHCSRLKFGFPTSRVAISSGILRLKGIKEITITSANVGGKIAKLQLKLRIDRPTFNRKKLVRSKRKLAKWTAVKMHRQSSVCCRWNKSVWEMYKFCATDNSWPKPDHKCQMHLMQSKRNVVAMRSRQWNKTQAFAAFRKYTVLSIHTVNMLTYALHWKRIILSGVAGVLASTQSPAFRHVLPHYVKIRKCNSR